MRSTARAEALSNRRFGTTDLAIVMGLWSAMAVLLGGVLSELATDTETPLAKAQSEAFALQLAQGLDDEPTSDPSHGGRTPASEMGDLALRSGVLGRDPWGHAYQYKIVAEGIVVWSQGKNNECDSTSALSRLDSGQSIAEFHFAGDDVGFVQPRHKIR
jgi:hypothetical protein